MTQPKFLASYGRRQGRRLRTGKRSLMEMLLPQLQLSLQDVEMWRYEDGGKMAASLFPHIPTSPHHPSLWLEIGFGGGEHLAVQAERYPGIGFIGCEPYINGIAGLLAHIRDHGLKNIRIHADDARKLIACLPDASLSRVFILYPDPWPKTRHHKRRLVSRETLDDLARVMKPGSELRLATDHADYATWMLERLLPHPAFAWTAKNAEDWLNPPPDWVITRYEEKRLAGPPTYLNFVKRE